MNNSKFTISHALFLLILLSIWSVYNEHGFINIDGARYIQQAYFFSIGDVDSALKVYEGPFFAYSISFVHGLTGLSLYHSAHFINIICFLAASLYFLKTVLLLAGDSRLILSGFLILFTSIPIVDSYLPMIFRDHGLWAGFMFGVYYYLRWFNSQGFLDGALLQMGFLFGALFRTESIVFLFLLVTISFFSPPRPNKRFICLITISSVLLFICILAGVYYFSEPDLLRTREGFLRLSEIYLRAKLFIEGFFHPLPIVLSDHYLKWLIDAHPFALKYGFLIYVLIYKWIAGLTFFPIFMAYSAYSNKLIDYRFNKPFYTILLITFLVAAINFFATFVLAGRYFVPNFWLIYVLSALGLGHWINQTFLDQSIKRKWMRSVLILTIFLYGLVVLFDKPSNHNEEKDAVVWLRSQGLDMKSIFFNSQRMCFYAEKYGECSFGGELSSFRSAKMSGRYKYLAIKRKSHDGIDDQVDGYVLVKTFYGSGTNRILFFRRIE